MIGRTLDGRYHVMQVLSAGGFGHTYIAQDQRIPGNPRCVVKQLKPVTNDPESLATARRLFRTEAETLARLGNHPQIPRLLAYFEEDQEFYLVQEFIEGHSLRQELDSSQRLGEDYGLDLLNQILPVLEFIHSQDVIHRDLKPDNLIRRPDGTLALIDFGAVKQMRSRLTSFQGTTATATVAIGTPGYMAIEQAQGKPRPSSDLYGLGMIAIHALTGKLPVELPEDPQTGELHWQSLASIRPGLAAILTRMTHYHFKDRYQSATEVRQALVQLNQPTLATVALKQKSPPPRRASVVVPPRQPQQQPKRNHTFLIGSGVAFLVAVAAGLGAAVMQNLNDFELDFNSLTNPTSSQACLATVRGNIRNEPSSRQGQQTVVTTVSNQTFPVTGIQTPGGWIELALQNQAVWAHRSIISNFAEMAQCLQQNGIQVTMTPDLPALPKASPSPEPAPSLQPSPIPKPSPEPTPSPEPAPTVSPAEAVQTYFDLINQSRLQDSWSRLSRDFQNQYSQGSFQVYQDWWSQVEKVRILTLNLVTQAQDQGVVSTQYQYLMKDGREVTESPKRFRLMWDKSRQVWVIDEQL